MIPVNAAIRPLVIAAVWPGTYHLSYERNESKGNVFLAGIEK